MCWFDKLECTKRGVKKISRNTLIKIISNTAADRDQEHAVVTSITSWFKAAVMKLTLGLAELVLCGVVAMVCCLLFVYRFT